MITYNKLRKNLENKEAARKSEDHTLLRLNDLAVSSLSS